MVTTYQPLFSGCPDTILVLSASLVPRLLWGGGGKRAWFAYAPIFLGNLHTTPLH